MSTTAESLLTTREAAAYVGVHRDHLRHLAAAGRGPVVAERRGRHGGGGNYYRREDLDAWQATRRPRKQAA